MPQTDAFIMPPRDCAAVKVRVGGQSLCERAILALKRGGVDRIFVSGDCALGAAAIRRLADRGISLLARGAGVHDAADGRPLVVVSADVVFEPGAVHTLVGRLAAQDVTSLAAYEASPGTFAALTPAAAVPVHCAASDRDILDSLDPIRVTSLGSPSCHTVATSGCSPAEHRFGGPIARLRRFSAMLRPVLWRGPRVARMAARGREEGTRAPAL